MGALAGFELSDGPSEPGGALAAFDSAGIYPVGVLGQHGTCVVDPRAQRQKSRFPLRDPVYRTVGALRLAGRVQLGCHLRAVAATLLAQPNRGRH